MMRCEEIAVELDAYLTGELEPEKSIEIKRHILQCSDCRTELARIQKENALYKEFQSTIGIPDTAWIDVQVERVRSKTGAVSATRNSRSPIHWWTWAAAAAVLLAIGLAWHFVVRQPASEIATNGASVSSPPIQQVMNDFEQATALLQTSYEEKKKSLDPQLVKELDRNLEVTRTAIAECKQVLKTNPGNDQAVEFLVLGFEKQISILRQITEEI